MWKKLLLGFVILILGVPALLAAAGFGWRMLRRHQIAEGMAIRTPNGIDERGFVRIGGVDQWITIRGQNRENPAVLLLHGGPGSPLSPLSEHFLPWERDFTVIQWDQRGAGKSYTTAPASPDIELMVSDGLEVSEYARRRLHRNRIILLGHSWGSVLGIRMIRARPEFFEAWVGTGQIVNMQKNEIAAYGRVIAKARAIGDTQAVQSLEKSGPPPYYDIRQMGIERRWAMQYEPGLRYGPLGPTGLFLELLTAPDYSLRDVSDFIKGVVNGDVFFGNSLNGPLMRVDLPALGTDFPMPFFIIEGAEDDVTPVSLSQSYFDRITAPHKAFFLIPNAGHMALLTQSDTFLRLLDANVRPLALKP
ncbi:MAG TPA: alpha/beta hydrolase [Bryobacteraceae bacterium]|jgi:pimeloyl-ACP methyl ester carboxylesterase